MNFNKLLLKKKVKQKKREKRNTDGKLGRKFYIFEAAQSKITIMGPSSLGSREHSLF